MTSSGHIQKSPIRREDRRLSKLIQRCAMQSNVRKQLLTYPGPQIMRTRAIDDSACSCSCGPSNCLLLCSKGHIVPLMAIYSHGIRHWRNRESKLVLSYSRDLAQSRVQITYSKQTFRSCCESSNWDPVLGIIQTLSFDTSQVSRS